MQTTIPLLEREIPWLDTEQMIEVDRAMMEDYRIDLVRMMENAGRCLAIVARDRFLDGSPVGKRVTVLAGSGATWFVHGKHDNALTALSSEGAEVVVARTRATAD